MNSLDSYAANKPCPLSCWERWASLLGRLLIFFIMVYVPLVFFTWTWRHYHVPKVASFQFLIMMLLACWAVIAVRRRMVRSALATPASFFFLIVMITGLGAVNMGEAWETITFIAASVIFIVLIPKFLTRFKDFEILIYFLGIMCLMVDIYALGQWFNWTQLFEITEKFGLRQLTHKPVAFMGNENYAAEFLNLAMPVCFAMMICFRRKPAQLIFYSFVTLFNAIVMVYIDCNATFAGFIVAIPIATALMIYFKAIPWSLRMGLFRISQKEMERRFRQIMVVVVLSITIFGTITASFENKLRTKMASMATWMDVNGDLIPDGVAPIVFRLQCMDAAARNIVDSPIMGIGAGNFKIMHPMFESQLERKVLGEETLARKVHNDHLWHAVEFGLFGLLAWYWIIAASIFAILCSLRLLEFQNIKAINKRNQDDDYKGIVLPSDVREFYFYLQWGILTSLIVALVSCMFGHTFVIASSAVIYWLLTGVCVAVYQNLYLAKKGIRNDNLGATNEPVTPIQHQMKLVPRFVWAGFFFLCILPFGVMNTKQLIAETWMRRGMSMHETNNYTKVFESFNKTMEYYPYQMETFYILGRYYIDSIVAVESALLQGNNKKNKLPSGLDINKLREYNEEGIAILQTDIFLNPNYKWAHNNLGVIYDRYMDLLNKHKSIVKSDPAEVQKVEKQISAVMEASKLAYSRVLEIDQEQVMALFNLGLGAIKQHQWKEAIEFLNEAILTDPTRFDIYDYLSSCYREAGDYKRAMRSAEKYLEKDIINVMRKKISSIRNPEDIVNIMKALRENKYALAVTSARLILHWNNNKAYNLYLGIADSLSQSGEDMELAAKAIEMAEKTNAVPRPEHFVWHAKIFERLKNYSKAAEKLNEYLRLNPKDDEIRHSLMLMYIQMSDLSQAQKTMAVLVENQPNNWQYLLTYSRLLAGLQQPWEIIQPFIQRAVQIGGDDARRIIVEKQTGNLLYPYLIKEPSLQALIGQKFMPADMVNQGTQ
jgi:tetratricopeptide (TPR) repeat protein